VSHVVVVQVEQGAVEQAVQVLGAHRKMVLLAQPTEGAVVAVVHGVVVEVQVVQALLLLVTKAAKKLQAAQLQLIHLVVFNM
jgi:hypothetical protein